MSGNGPAVGEIASPDWHALRVINIVVDFAKLRLRLASSERAELESVRRELYRDLGLDPEKKYARSPDDGKVREVSKDERRAGVSDGNYAVDRGIR